MLSTKTQLDQETSKAAYYWPEALSKCLRCNLLYRTSSQGNGSAVCLIDNFFMDLRFLWIQLRVDKYKDQIEAVSYPAHGYLSSSLSTFPTNPSVFESMITSPCHFIHLSKGTQAYDTI